MAIERLTFVDARTTHSLAAARKEYKCPSDDCKSLTVVVLNGVAADTHSVIIVMPTTTKLE